MRAILIGFTSLLGMAACQTVPERDLISQSSSQLVFEMIPAEYETITETAYVNNDTTELVGATPPPGTYETVYETVVVRPAHTDFDITPVKFIWVDGEYPGEAMVPEYVSPVFERVAEEYVGEAATTELFEVPPACVLEDDGSITITEPKKIMERVVPAVTQQAVYWRVKSPASIKETVVKNIIKDGKTRILASPMKVTEKVIPAVTGKVPRKVVNSPWHPTERLIPAGEREVTCRLEVTPEQYIARDQDGNIIRRFDERANFEAYRAQSKSTKE